MAKPILKMLLMDDLEKGKGKLNKVSNQC